MSEEFELGPSIVSVRIFFYDAYSRCRWVFLMELLASNSPDEQLMGARILRSSSMSKRFSDDTLQKIGTTFSGVERLVEMLSWKDPEEEEIRQSGAEILSKIAGKKQHSL